MRTLLIILILAVISFAAYEYHQDLKRQDRERLERAVSACWQNVAPGSKAGADLCKTMAKQLEAK